MKRISIFVMLVAVCSFLSACGYNTLQEYEEAVFKSWSDVESNLQRRADLIPNLVETVKGYASHEKETLEGVIEARLHRLPEALLNTLCIASVEGERFTADNIRQRLNMRDFMDTLRASGVDTGGPPALGQGDRQAFANQLDRLLASRLGGARLAGADLAGADRAVAAALGLLLGRERGTLGIDNGDPARNDGKERFALVSLSEAAEAFAKPINFGLTSREGLLGGSLPSYNLYQAKEGWVAVATL